MDRLPRRRDCCLDGLCRSLFGLVVRRFVCLAFRCFLWPIDICLHPLLIPPAPLGPGGLGVLFSPLVV